MSFIRNANPDATNSELDAKQVIFNDYKFADEIDDPLDNITQEIKEQVIEQYVELVVDNMDIKTMMQFITDLLTDEYHDYSDMELQDQIECTHDEELYTELVDNVTSQGG